MTDIRKVTRRRTIEVCATVRRRLVIEIRPGDVLAIREEGRRTWAVAPLPRLYVTMAKWNADAVRAAKKAARKAGRV